MLSLTVNGTNFTSFLVPGLSPVLTDPLNQPKTLSFAVYPAANGFFPVVANQYVTLQKDGATIFSGYVTATPPLQNLGSGPNFYSGYQVIAQSEEWAFDSIEYGIVPDFVNEHAGDILKTLVALVAPNSPLSLSGVISGPPVSRFIVNPVWTFSQAAQALANSYGWRWFVLSGVLYFLPQNDAAYGYEISGQTAAVTSSNVAIANDVTIIGPAEPQAYARDNFLGDGSTRSFSLSQIFFGNNSSELLFSDIFASNVLNSDVWSLSDPTSAVKYTPKSLVVSGGSQSLGETVLSGKSSFELGGELLFDHGVYTFQNLSVGILGGIYSASDFAESSCVVGFWLTGNPAYTGIQAIVNGQTTGTPLVTSPNYSYRLQTYISSDEIYRYSVSLRSLTGQFGDTQIASGGYVTLVVTATNLGDPAALPVSTVIYDGRIAALPSFGLYALFNSLGMFLTSTIGPEISQLPPLRVRSLSNGRVNGVGLQQNVNGIWNVQLLTPPAADEGISIDYRSIGLAEARLVNNQGIASYGVIPVTITAPPATIRTTQDCEILGQAYLTDHQATIYQGEYVSPAQSLETIPVSGRFVVVDVPVTKLFSSLVTQVKITFTNFSGDLAIIDTTFGFASLMTQYQTTAGSGNLAALDFTLTPTSLPAIASFREISVIDTALTLDAGRPPLSFFEVRTSDSDWGQRAAANFIGVFSTETFTLTRVSESDVFYIREADSGLIPKYSRYPVVVTATGYPAKPAAPASASIVIGSNIIYSLTLTNTTDVIGVEVRAADNITVLFSANYANSASFTFSANNSSALRSVSAYFYTKNRRGEYSDPLLESVTLPLPSAPVISISSQNGTTLNFALTTENRTDIIQEILEIDGTSSSFNNIIFTDSRNYQYSFSTVLLPGPGTYYARARKSDALGFGPNTSPVFTFVVTQQEIDSSIPNPPTNFAVGTQSAVIGSDGSVLVNANFSWTASTSTNVVGYVIEYARQGQTVYSFFHTTGVTQCTVSGLAAGIAYTAAIAAVNPVGNTSAFTAFVNFTTPSSPQAPAAPVGLTAIGGFRLIGLTWTPNTEPDLAGYNIEFSSDNVNWNVIAKTGATYYVDKGDSTRGQLAIGTIYYYRIAAFNSSGNISAYSGSVSATTTAIGNGDFVANSILASTILATGSITAPLLDVSGGANDVNNAINDSLVKIQPGQILISSGSTLATWRSPANNTLIDGGQIATNSIQAESVTVGLRGVQVNNLIFHYSDANKNTLVWDNGGLGGTPSITYPDNNGNVQTVTINNGSVAWTSGIIYIYLPASSIVVPAPASYTLAAAAALAGQDDIVLASFSGDGQLIVTYGQTLINGDHITTGTITASNIAAGTITGALIAAGTITASNIAAGTITSQLLATTGLFVGGGNSMPGVLEVFDNQGNIVGYIGTFTSQFLNPNAPNTVYGAWFKTLGVGGTVAQPNLYADDVGNIWLINGTIYAPVKVQDGSGNTPTASSIATSSVTGAQRNLVPDSDLKYLFTFWTQDNPSQNVVEIVTGPDGSNMFRISSTTNIITNHSTWFPVTPGQSIVLSAYEDATHLNAATNYAVCGLDWVGRQVVFEVDLYQNQAAQRLGLSFTVPAGVTQMRVYVGVWSSSGNASGYCIIGHIQVETGTVMTAYRPNSMDDITGGLYPQLTLGSDYSETIGSIHDKTHSQVVCPVASTIALPAQSAPLQLTRNFGAPVEMVLNGDLTQQTAVGSLTPGSPALIGPGSGAVICNDWTVLDDYSNLFEFYLQNSSGVIQLVIATRAGVTFPANGNFYGSVVGTPINAVPGQSFTMSAHLGKQGSGNPPASVNITISFGLRWNNSNGNLITWNLLPNWTTLQSSGTETATVTAPASSAHAIPWCMLQVTTGSSAWVPTLGLDQQFATFDTLQATTPIGQATWLEWNAYVDGNIADLTLDCNNNTGYMMRLDGRAGYQTCGILRASDFKTTWTLISGSAATNPAPVTGWHLLQAWVGRNGYYELYLDGVLECVATDTSYTPNGALWGGFEVTTGPQFGVTSAATPDPNQIDPGGQALINFASTGHGGKHLGNVGDDPNNITGRIIATRHRLTIAANTWVILGTWTFVQDAFGHTLRIEYTGGAGYNTNSNQQTHVTAVIRSSNCASGAPNISGATWSSTGAQAVQSIKIVSHGGSTAQNWNQWDIYAYVSSFADGNWEIVYDPGDIWAWTGTLTGTDPGAASSTVVVAQGNYTLDQYANWVGVIGQNGGAQLVVGPGGTLFIQYGSNGFGNQVRRFEFCALLTGINDGETIYFNSSSGTPALLDANNLAFAPFITVPEVFLVPSPPPGIGGQPSGLVTLTSSSVTTTSFVVNSKGNFASNATINLTYDSGSGAWGGTWTVPAGTTCTIIEFLSTFKKLLQVNGRYVPGTLTVNCSASPGGTTSYTINYMTNDVTYRGNASINVSITGGTVITFNMTGAGDNTTSTATIITTYSGTNTSINGVSFYTAISEQWNG